MRPDEPSIGEVVSWGLVLVIVFLVLTHPEDFARLVRGR